MLFVPAGGNALERMQSNASTVASGMGTTVTPAVGSKGAWAQVFASLDADTFGLMVNINSNTLSVSSRNTVVDVGVGPSGSEVVVIPDLIAGNAAAYSFGGGLFYYFPLALPAGSRVAVRAQNVSGTTAFLVYMQAYQQPLNPSLNKTASYVSSIGMTVPQGTSVTPGVSGNQGAWTLLGTTTRNCWFWQLGSQVTSVDTAHQVAAIHLDLAEGNGTDFNILVEDFLLNTASTEAATAHLRTAGCEVPVPAGRNIYVRATTTTVTFDPLFVTAYGAGG